MEESTPSTPKFVCENCGREFDSEMSLRSHSKIHKKDEKTKITGLYPEIRSPTDILKDILTEVDVPQNVVTFLCRVSDAVGGIHPIDLYHRLRSMKTGLKSDAEVLDVCNLYALELEKERQKASELGKPFPFTRPLQPITSPPFPAYGISPATPSPPISFPTPQPPSIPPPSAGYTPPYASSYVPPPQPPSPPATLTEEKISALISEHISKALAEKRTTDEIAELRKKVTEDIPRMVDEKITKTLETLSSTLKEKIEEIKSLIPSQSPKLSEEVTSKDLELLKASIEKTLTEKVAEAEKKVWEERLSRLEAKIEEKSRPITPPPSEGYSSDGPRLIADTIKTVVRPGEWYPGRAISEIIIRLVPTQTSPPERKEVRGEKSLIEKFVEVGGEVE